MPIKISIRLFLISMLFFVQPYIYGIQIDIWPNLKQLNLQFSDDDNITRNRIEQQKIDAGNQIALAVEELDRNALEEAFNELFSASSGLFDLYDKYCRSTLDKLPETLPDEVNRVAELERHARENMEKAEVLRMEAGKAEGIEKIEQIYRMAFDLELLALLKKGRGLRIYQDYPVIYAYPWDNDFTNMNGSPEKAIRLVEIKEHKEPGDKPGRELTDEGICFIIQIAAHTDKITESGLKAIYNGDIKISFIYEDNLYKYYLGPYNSFDEAERVMKSLNMENVFIAAYYDGRRIGVREARARQAQQD